MKKQLLILVLLLVMGQQGFAQIPEQAKDISPLLYGEKIPDGVLKSPDAKTHSVSSIIKKKPTILLIYRGGWCPYCNAHLAEIQQAESQIIELGYQLVAISPDSPENTTPTDEKHKLKYDLYSDPDGDFLKDLGIIFKAPEKYSDMLNKRSNGKNKGFLPVPSAKLISENEKLQEKVKAMQDDGVELQACIACASSYNVVDELKALGFEVKEMGKPLTDYLKSDAQVITF